nr:hypothetical protein [Tanacetum cinerariifolium]
TAATPPPFGYRIATRISVQPHILIPFRIESEMTIAESRRADGKLIDRLRRERQYFRTVATHYAQEAPPSTDYIPGPEAPPSPDYIPEPEAPPSPDYIPEPEDDVFPAEEQPLPAAALPTTESPGYIPESDPDEDLEEDDDEDPKEDPADYPADHDDKEEEEDPSGDDADEEDEEQDEDDNDEEEEHPASADSIPPPPALRVTARITFRPQPPTLSFTKEDAERFLAMPIPPPSP